jgi:hypothetical protein
LGLLLVSVPDDLGITILYMEQLSPNISERHILFISVLPDDTQFVFYIGSDVGGGEGFSLYIPFLDSKKKTLFFVYYTNILNVKKIKKTVNIVNINHLVICANSEIALKFIY